MTDEHRWSLLAQKKAEVAILAACGIFRKHGIEPILIKGWAAARNYPPSVPRLFGDIDLAVSAVDYPTARTLVETPESGVRGVDLHRELRYLDTLNWDQLMSRSELIPVEGGEIRVLSPEDHLRVLCSHWLVNGGHDRERLLDIVYAVKNRPESFDWSKCLDVISETRRGWIISTIGLAHKYQGLSLDGLPFETEARRLPGWLIKSVERSWERGDRLRGIDESITDGRMFITQLVKRFPPNPVQATVNCEGKFDDSTRLVYQVRDFFGRATPSVRRLFRAIVDQYRWTRSSK